MRARCSSSVRHAAATGSSGSSIDTTQSEHAVLGARQVWQSMDMTWAEGRGPTTSAR